MKWKENIPLKVQLRNLEVIGMSESDWLERLERKKNNNCPPMLERSENHMVKHKVYKNKRI